ncbi:AfsR/SARP family transcriptional regulator [Streptomyces sp. NBC_00525]|uniref:AfsR/SARP family transcriptional regulator n=1 Tax=Streptomyces sp. NBC_00525 TaxID=2903660 RepID=UPI002E81B210|nr:tetratricopeptide repeat protein [Streptomyces sp. NBC_00525]WUC94714.1 tetratricopeptide repeat protein [Streptomyces sp. NBC_00525]
MEFQVLGPVGLRLDGHWLKLGSDKERVLLAAFALDVGRPLAIDELMNRLWDGDPPARARNNTHSYVSRIRRYLRKAGTGPDAPFIDTGAHTYTLRTPRGSVDRQRFQTCVDAAFAGTDDARTVELLTRAEELWQGDALAGLPGLWAATVRRTLMESRLSASTARIAAALRLGRFAEQIGELTALVDRHPDDENLIGLLMVSLHGSGRYGEALRVYQRARQSLMAEYGALPGAELNLIHQGVLERRPAHELPHSGGTRRTGGSSATVLPAPGAAETAETAGATEVSGADEEATPTEPVEPVAAEPATAAGSAASAPLVPPRRNLPQQPPLVGRRSELRALTSMIADRVARGDSVVTVEAVSGMAGVGKTALAVATAQLLADAYPDGQLYIDLRGHSPAEDPLTARAALATLLRLLGAPAFSIPVELEGRTALWRTMLAGRRAVIVLDDATGPAQVRPLLPSGESCLTIVTSRRHLTGIPQALSVALDVLPEADAIELFRRFAGEARTRDTGQIARIVRMCGLLPLAIELVAHRFRARTSWTLGVLAERLARSPERLAEIHSADQEQEMARAFALSYRGLTAQQRTAFRRLGLHPGPEFTTPAAAALLDLPYDTTERLLEGLVACHLLREPVPDRYRYHDLLREYACSLSESADGEEERRRALERLTDFYVATADLADRAAYPRRVRPAAPAPARPEPRPLLRDAAAARSWLASERGNLLAVEEYARRNGAAGQAARLACVLAGFLQTECHWHDARKLLGHAVAVWDRPDGDASALCHALIDLCAADASVGDYEEATEAGERALDLARTLRDRPAEAAALRVLGSLNWHLGENRKALVLLQKSFALVSRTGDTWEQARSRNNIAVTMLFLGERERALRHFLKALEGFRNADDRTASAKTLNNIGELQMQAGDVAAARRSFEESLTLLEAGGNRYDRTTVRRNLAETVMESGDSETALLMFGEALTEFAALGDRKSQAETLVGIGEAHWRLGRVDESGRRLLEALKIAQNIGAAHHEVQALRRLGRADFAAGRLTDAADRLRAAVAVATRTDDIAEETAARTLLAKVLRAADDNHREIAEETLNEPPSEGVE